MRLVREILAFDREAGPRAVREWRSCRRLHAILLAVLVSGAAACTGAQQLAAATMRTPGGAALAQASNSASSKRVEVTLPDLRSIELPPGRKTRIAPSASPLRELLAAATAGGLQVTHDLAGAIGTGATEVTWTAWEGVPGKSAARETRTERISVFPFGQAPVGLTADDRGTVSNHSPKVVRDSAGRAHMAWLDSGRPGVGSRVMYRRAALDATGALTWETEPLGISDQASEMWNSYPVIEASANAVHIAWAGPNTVRYRRLVRSGGAWAFGPIRDTRVPGPGEDWGPGIGLRRDDEIHLLTPSGQYALSNDGGQTWTADQVPIPAGLYMKGPALAVDARGNGHITFTGKVRSSATGRTYGKQHGAYWQLRYVRRRAGGGWEDAQNLLGGRPEWADPGTQEDVLADFSDVAVDRNRRIHVGWHGSVNTRAYSYDEAFYVRRPAIAADTWGPWGPVESLHPHDPAKGDYFSYAPSLSLDGDSEVVLAVLFFDTVPNVGSRFDAALRVLRDGRIEGPTILLTRAAREAVAADRPQNAWSVWFPCAARRVLRDADGRAWLDVLQTVVTSLDYKAPHHIVYQRLEVTSLVGRRP